MKTVIYRTRIFPSYGPLGNNPWGQARKALSLLYFPCMLWQVFCFHYYSVPKSQSCRKWFLGPLPPEREREGSRMTIPFILAPIQCGNLSTLKVKSLEDLQYFWWNCIFYIKTIWEGIKREEAGWDEGGMLVCSTIYF